MDETDWPRGKTTADVNMFFLTNQFLCDVTFEVGADRVQRPAHRVILASRSPVFFAMFCGTMADHTNTISIPDIDPDTFEELLRYAYTDECDLNGDNVVFILYAARKYDIDSLVSKCVEFLTHDMTPDTVCTVLNQGVLFDETAMIEKCVDYIFKNPMDCLESDDFLLLTRQSVKLIFESDYLTLGEEHVYDFAVSWASNQCRLQGIDDNVHNQRAALGDLLYTIRFPCMEEKTLLALKPPLGLLTHEEFTTLHEDLNNNTRRLHGIFTYRKRFYEPPDVFARFDITDLDSGFTTKGDIPHTLSFSCSEDGYLRGVGVFTPCNPGLVRGSLHLMDGDEEIYSDEHRVFLTYTKDHIDEIVMDSRVLLKKDVVYTLKIYLVGQKTYYGRNGSGRVCCKGVGVTFYDSHIEGANANTNVSEGQIYCLYLYA